MRFDPSGALWLDDGPTLILADLHLGYAWAQRRRGDLGPVVEGGSQQRLWQLVDSLRPRRVVLLGDIVHAPRPSPDEQASIQQTLQGSDILISAETTSSRFRRRCANRYLGKWSGWR